MDSIAEPIPGQLTLAGKPLLLLAMLHSFLWGCSFASRGNSLGKKGWAPAWGAQPYCVGLAVGL